MFFKYFLLVMFCVFVLKSAFRGFTSEIISLISTTIAGTTALLIYKPGIKYALLSITIFGVIQAIGIYVALSNKKPGWSQFFLGAVLGAFKFLLLLIIVTAIVLATNLAAQEFLENSVIKAILPFSTALKWMFVKLI